MKMLEGVLSKLLVYGFLLGSSAIGIISLQLPDSYPKNSKLTPADYQIQEKKEKNRLNALDKVSSMGFDNVIANWLYLDFIQYFGDEEARKQTGYSLVPDYFSQVVEKDPRFVDAILRLEVGNTLFAGFPEKSVALLDKTLKSISPKFIVNIPPYYLWRTKGNDELLFLGDISATQKSYEKTIEWAKFYNDQDSKNIIQLSQQSLDFLKENPDSKKAQIGAWVSVLANGPDDKTIKRVIKEIEALGAKVSRNQRGSITIKMPQ